MRITSDLLTPGKKIFPKKNSFAEVGGRGDRPPLIFWILSSPSDEVSEEALVSSQMWWVQQASTSLQNVYRRYPRHNYTKEIRAANWDSKGERATSPCMHTQTTMMGMRGEIITDPLLCRMTGRLRDPSSNSEMQKVAGNFWLEAE